MGKTKDQKTCTTSTDNIPEKDIINREVESFKALADHTRLKLVYLLEDKELCSCQMVNSLEIAQPTISHHLSVLVKSGIVEWEKKGKWKYFKLKNKDLIKIIKKIS
ncbi:MAG: metalloregulator ArsR/SmtB family transcription factor [Methanobacteriaceae archaeon]|jgi:ArsR family transcriptional regulator|nr:metalloregulator ArsR/SmtB family transcription factor [Methanobacteriaceae archaeon]